MCWKLGRGGGYFFEDGILLNAFLISVTYLWVKFFFVFISFSNRAFLSQIHFWLLTFKKFYFGFFRNKTWSTEGPEIFSVISVKIVSRFGSDRFFSGNEKKVLVLIFQPGWKAASLSSERKLVHADKEKERNSGLKNECREMTCWFKMARMVVAVVTQYELRQLKYRSIRRKSEDEFCERSLTKIWAFLDGKTWERNKTLERDQTKENRRIRQ